MKKDDLIQNEKSEDNIQPDQENAVENKPFIEKSSDANLEDSSPFINVMSLFGYHFLSNIAIFSVKIIVYVYLGQLIENQYLSTMLYSEFIIGLLCETLFRGISNGYDTLSCLCMGTPAYSSLGKLFLKFQVLILYSCSICFIVILFFAKSFFLYLIKGKLTPIQEEHFNIVIFLHILTTLLFSCYLHANKYINIIGKQAIICLVAIVGMVIHLTFCYIASNHLKMVKYLTEVSFIIIYGSLYAISIFYIYKKKPHEESVADFKIEYLWKFGDLFKIFIFSLPHLLIFTLRNYTVIIIILMTINISDDSYFVYGINHQVEYIGSAIGVALMYAVYSFVGTNLAKGKIALTRKYISLILMISVGVIMTATVLYYFLSGSLILQFSNKETLIQTQKTVKFQHCVSFFYSQFSLVLVAIFQAVNKQKISLLFNALCLLVMWPVLSYIAQNTVMTGLAGIYLGINIGNTANLVLHLVVLLGVDWEALHTENKEEFLKWNEEKSS